jgi:diguanylate cyclase (GGDEF)-like protein/PAS domain S-box-containing protein
LYLEGEFAILASSPWRGIGMLSSSLQEIKQRVETLEQELFLLRSVLEAFPDPVFILDSRKGFLRTNSKGEEMLGYTREDLQGMVFLDLIDLDDFNSVQDGFEALKKYPETRLKTWILNRRGEKIAVELFGHRQEEMFCIVLKDLRETVQFEEAWERRKKELTEKIRERDQYARELQAMKDLYKEKMKEIERMRDEATLLSHVDDLTEIYNHRFFIHQLTLEIARRKRYPSPLSLLMIDVDFFKHYNDTNGHLAGDQVLKATAMLIQRAVRQTDMVARYGGEEFAAILINADRETALEIGERVRRSVSETDIPNEHLQPNGDFTVSIGIATLASPLSSSLEELLREADNALYRAKRKGRNRVEG